MRFSRAAAFAAPILLAACGNGATDDAAANSQREIAARGQTIGLLTSLPIVWPEASDIGELLATDAPRHWAMSALEQAGDVRAVDSLADEAGAFPLPPGALLVMAQPYPLSPQENVALDNFVRAGGRVLLFVDPMLTFESTFALGDRRRPQDIAMLSPILTRWGLTLRYDDEQPAGERPVAFGDARIPVRLAGSFARSGPQSQCALHSAAIIAECKIGKGQVLAVADAALLEPSSDTPDLARSIALRTLIGRLAT